MKRIECRRAVRQDLPEINKMLTELQRLDGWDYLGQVIEEWMEERPGGAYIACDGQDVVGITSTSFAAADEAWFQGIRVLPSHRRTGVGADLARYQVEDAFSSGARVARLAVLRTNESAKRMVTGRMGFRKTRLWSVCTIPLPPSDLQAGVKPTAVTGPDKQTVLRMLRNRQQRLICAWPHPWMLYSYPRGMTRMTEVTDTDQEWLLVWPGTGDNEYACVCHAGIVSGTFDCFLLVDLLINRSTGTDATEYVLGLLSVVHELVKGTKAERIMFSVSSQSFAVVDKTAQTLGLVGDQFDHWAMEIYERQQL